MKFSEMGNCLVDSGFLEITLNERSHLESNNVVLTLTDRFENIPIIIHDFHGQHQSDFDFMEDEMEF